MDEKINKIIVFYDYKKDVPIFALVNYTQRVNGESRDFTIIERNEEGIRYYEEVCARQSNCRDYQLESIGKKEIFDVKDYNPNKDYFAHYIVPEFDVSFFNTSKKSEGRIDVEKKKIRKKIIKITSIATAAVIALLSSGYAISNAMDNKKKAIKVLTKIETQNDSNLLSNEVKDLVQYIESENDDNMLQQEEIDINDRVLYGLAQNDDLQKNVIDKAQGLLKNCISYEYSRYRCSKDDAYKYFMYMASLFQGGDTIYGVHDAILAMEMQDSYKEDLSAKASEFSSNQNGNPSLNRIMYSAREYESEIFKRMPLLMKKILMEQFLGVCKNLNIKYRDKDLPSWWASLKSTYTSDKLFEEIEERCNVLRDKLITERENSTISSKKH